MKLVHLYEIIREYLKHRKLCTLEDLFEYKQEYEKINKDIIIRFTKDDVWYALYSGNFSDEFYLDKKDNLIKKSIKKVKKLII
jgi:hypothetical protein